MVADTPSRLGAVDVLRGFALLGMILVHVRERSQEASGLLDLSAGPSTWGSSRSRGRPSRFSSELASLCSFGAPRSRGGRLSRRICGASRRWPCSALPPKCSSATTCCFRTRCAAWRCLPSTVGPRAGSWSPQSSSACRLERLRSAPGPTRGPSRAPRQLRPPSRCDCRSRAARSRRSTRRKSIRTTRRCVPRAAGTSGGSSPGPHKAAGSCG